ncbi:hypothetical protein ACFQBQ_09605 [Granulicella cerasi]|uniref:Uncharacterized protein n=2 Tax=Granulicella cerasi TaxID=741063 RepID=A0ABW1Z9I4_9BACT
MAALTAFTIGGFWWHLQHSFSAAISWRSKETCSNRVPCTFTLGQIFPGEWDHLIVFDMTASEDEIHAVVGTSVERPELQRLIVFMQGDKVVNLVTEAQGVEHPNRDEVLFEQVAENGKHQTIRREWGFVAGRESDTSPLVLTRILPGQVVI